MSVVHPTSYLFTIPNKIVLLLNNVSRVFQYKKENLLLTFIVHICSQGHKVISVQEDTLGSSAPTFAVHFMLSANNICFVRCTCFYRGNSPRSALQIHINTLWIPPLQTNTSLHAILDIRTNLIKKLWAPPTQINASLRVTQCLSTVPVRRIVLIHTVCLVHLLPMCSHECL